MISKTGKILLILLSKAITLLYVIVVFNFNRSKKFADISDKNKKSRKP